MRLPTRIANLKGELFSSTFTYGLTAAIRLCSSVVLTRLLTPEAYGIFALLTSLLFTIELLSDVGSRGLLVRHPRGNEIRFVHTLWTIRLIRGGLNFSIAFFAAPIIAGIYHAPVLTSALRTLSFIFLISGIETMSFSLAIRDQKARISNYVDMVSTAVMTICVIVLASVLKNHLALVYGALLQRAIVACGSFLFYRNIGVGFAFDREAVLDQFRFARLVLPSSVLFIVLSQYDKLVLLKLFDLTLLGVYGIASNMVAPISGVVVHNAQAILYARCAEYFRSDRTTACTKYYQENRRLLLIGVTLPAMLAGFSQLIVSILYDSRYSLAGHVLMVFGLGAITGAFQNASENLLLASGRTHIFLMVNALRLCSLVPATLLGYLFFGFNGFLWSTLVATIPILIYLGFEQKKLGLLDLREECRLFFAAFLIFMISFGISHLLLKFAPLDFLHQLLKDASKNLYH